MRLSPSLSLAFLLAAALAFAAGCGDGAKKKRIGATCGGDAECATGLCYYDVCLDPQADDDGDGLVNSVEAALGTNPFNRDTDGDGVDDGDEVDANLQHIDTDGDGKPDAIESATADADGDCVPDQFDPNDDDPGEGATHPAVATVCPHTGACAAPKAVLAVACPNGLDEPVCAYWGVPDYSATDDSCDGIDNNCDGATDEDGDCGPPLPEWCDDVGTRLDGTYEIDPDGDGPLAPFMAQCLFDEAGGDWIRLDANVVAAMQAEEEGEPRQYLLRSGRSWYRSPVTTAVWSYSAGASVEGLWTFYQAQQSYLDGYDCDDDVSQSALGVGCTSASEQGFAVVADPAPDEAAGTVTLDESGFPRMMSTGDLAEGVEVWVRLLDCLPDPGQILSDGGFEGLEGGEQCWYAAGDGERLKYFSFDQTDLPPGGVAPSLRADNPTVGNDLWSVQIIQPELTFLPRRTYLASFWAKAKAPRTIIGLAHTASDDPFAYQSFDLGESWQRYQLWFSPRQPTLRGMFELQFGETSTASVWVDDVSVVDLGQDVCATYGGPADGDFTLPVLVCWEVFGDGGGPTVAYDPSETAPNASGPSLKLVAAGTDVPSSAGILQRGITLPSNANMLLHFWARAEGRTNVGFDLGAGEESVANGLESVSTEWTEHVISLSTFDVSPAGGYTLSFQIGNPSGYAIWLDNVWMEVGVVR